MFIGFYVVPLWLATSIGVVSVVVSCVYSLRVLIDLVPLDRLPGPLKWGAALMRLTLPYRRLTGACCAGD